MMVGYFCTSRKLGLRRSLSRIPARVSTEVAAMVASSIVFDGSAGSNVADPLTLVKAPRTVDTPRCRTENCAEVCMGSIFQLPACATAVAARAREVTKLKTKRDILIFLLHK